MAGTELRQDNITLNLGSGGPDVATDFISSGVSGGHVKYVKLDYGGDGQSNLVTTANAFPVRIYGLDPTFGDTARCWKHYGRCYQRHRNLRYR